MILVTILTVLGLGGWYAFFLRACRDNDVRCFDVSQIALAMRVSMSALIVGINATLMDMAELQTAMRRITRMAGGKKAHDL